MEDRWREGRRTKEQRKLKTKKEKKGDREKAEDKKGERKRLFLIGPRGNGARERGRDR